MPVLSQNEVTFAMIKSHIIDGGKLGQVIEAIATRSGLVILAAKVMPLSSADIAALYHEHRKKPYWADIVRSVNGMCMPMALMGPGAVLSWRAFLGDTNSMAAAPDTLRGEFGSRTIIADNVAHGSDSAKSASWELGIFFPAAISLR